MAGITLVGLGSGDLSQMEPEARTVLSSASELWLRTISHPAIAALRASTTIRSFDEQLASAASPAAAKLVIVSTILELGQRPDGVIYGVPGDPRVAEATGAAIYRRALADGLPVRVIVAPSLVDRMFSALGDQPLAQFAVCDVLDLGELHVPPVSPEVPLLVLHLTSQALAGRAAAVLAASFPATHGVHIIRGSGTPPKLQEFELQAIPQASPFDALSALYVPPLSAGTSIETLQHVVARLRAPDGCPWDQEQTHASLRRHLLEEAYETVAAMDSGNPASMMEEFGDLLLQIILNAEIGRELGEFHLGDISRSIHDKIIRRHPHVFGDLKVDGVDTVLANWERLKESEREGQEGKGGLLDGVPLALPALGQAQEFQERAARVGFDWPEIQGVLEKIREEIEEVRQAADSSALADEVGDLLFALVNLARWKGIDAESALRAANARFKRRLSYIEANAGLRKRRLSELTLDEMEALWQQAKASEP